MINLNEHQSTFISEPGIYPCTITVAQDDYTKSGKECVALKFETDDNRAIGCSYVEAVFWKLFRVAQAAGLSEKQRSEFEPKMLLGKQVKVKVVADDQGRCGVSEVFAIDTPNKPKSNDDIPF